MSGTVPSKVVEQYLNEGVDYEYAFKYSQSLSGSTVTFLAYDEESNDSGTQLATASGAGAGVFQTVTLNTGLLPVGRYLVEIWKDKDTVNEFLLYPPDNTIYRLYVQDRRGDNVVVGTFDETFDLTFG